MNFTAQPQLKIAPFVGATFLVAGTCIGGGMLALPLMTSLSGFLPSSVMLVISWAFMTTTGLLFLEANLWLGTDKHIVSMAQTLLGKFGKWVTILLYIFICYISLVAYISGGAELILGLTRDTNLVLSKTGACFVFGIFFGLFLYLGTTVLGRINTILVVGMILSYFIIISLGSNEISIMNLKYINWKKSLFALPLLLTSFSFQTMMPSLTPYLQGHAKGLRWAIILGTTIPLIAYFVWDWFILGIVPLEGSSGLKEALNYGLPVTEPLRKVVKNPLIYSFAGYFAFFALVTSFLGIALGLFDFLSDGLKIVKRNMNKVYLGLLVVAPSIFFAIIYPKAFLAALDASGGYGDAILNGIIPALMVWRGRYYLKMSGDQKLPGGRCILLAVIIFAVGIVILETLVRINFFQVS